MKLRAIFILCMLLTVLALHLKLTGQMVCHGTPPTPITAITGFDIDDLGGGKYQFFPLCGGRRCDLVEIQKNIIEWEFVDQNDYSTAPQPIRIFSATGPKNVIFRWSGIKEDVDCRELPGANRDIPSQTCRTTICPQDWNYNFTNSQTKMVTASGPDGIKETEFWSLLVPKLSSNDTCPIVVIGDAYNKLVWEETVEFPVVFYNPDKFCTNEVKAVIGGEIASRTTPLRLNCHRPNTGCDRQKGELVISRTLAPNSYAVVLIRTDLPAAPDPIIKDAVTLKWEFESNGIQCGGLCTDASSRKYNIDSTIDPNAKLIVFPKPYYVPGDTIFYEIQFENEGSFESGKITVFDPLDGRFEWKTARHRETRIKSSVNNRRRAVTPSLSEPTWVPNLNRGLMKIEFVEDPNAPILQGGDTAIVKFSVRLRKDIGIRTCFLPDWLTRMDSTFEDIPNTAYTLFENEGVFYSGLSNPTAKLLTMKEVPNLLFWILLVLLILLIILLILLLIWSRRKRRQRLAAHAST
jgi:hypothetical protein